MSGRPMSRQGILLLVLLLAAAALLRGQAAWVPGDVNSLCYYDNFFYNLPENDFFYYFNDALLWTEPPDEIVYENAMRDKYLRLARRHRQVKEFIRAHGQPQNLTITFDLADGKAFGPAAEFMALLGLDLSRDGQGAIAVKAADEAILVGYDSFVGLKAGVLQEQLRRTNIFFFKLRETEVRLPWDLGFLNAVTGLKLDRDTFFEQLLAGKRLSLLLAVLYRLGDDEIALVGGGSAAAAAPGWKRIYLDKRTLMGMLVLSGALRAGSGRLLLPGGDRAAPFWAALVGSDPLGAPREFIASLCTLDNGKLNYMYVFSYFLPEESRRLFFFDYDPARAGRIYRRVLLGDNERIRANAFPRLENFTYFSLPYLLRTVDGRVDLPLGVEAWARALGLELAPDADWCAFLEGLLAASGKPSRKATLLRKFMTLYAKFGERRLLLTPEFLARAAAGFASHAILLDYIERIPLKEPESVDALIAWQDGIQRLDQEERKLFTPLGQSLLEMLAQAAGHAPVGVDFDAVVRGLTAIPLKRPTFYDGLFALLARLGNGDPHRFLGDDALAGFVFRGLVDQEMVIRDETYVWRPGKMAAADLQEMMRSQETCTLSALVEINGLLADLASETDGAAGRQRRLREACDGLPYPDFSADAPRILKERVIPYEKKDLAADLDELLKKCARRGDPQSGQAAIAAFKERYLLPLAKDYLLALAYALNARSPSLRIFINPNLARLHDFADTNASPWEAGCAPGEKTEFSGYYLRGGLSRLGPALAANWRGQLFQKTIFSNEQTQALIGNLLAMLPQPQALHSPSRDALLVELAIEMLTRSREEGTVNAALAAAGRDVVSGYHYRRLNGYLTGAERDYQLFFSELRQLGARLAEQEPLLALFSRRDDLASYLRPPLSTLIAGESDAWGGILFNSFGSLAPRACAYLPQEVSQLFGSGWTSGETLDEFKVKAASLAAQSGLPQRLDGQFLFDFIATVGRAVYAQNHVKDYHSVHFVLDVMNNGHLRKTLKKLQAGSYLRLR